MVAAVSRVLTGICQILAMAKIFTFVRTNQCRVLSVSKVVLNGVQASECDGFSDVSAANILSMIKVGNGA